MIFGTHARRLLAALVVALPLFVSPSADKRGHLSPPLATPDDPAELAVTPSRKALDTTRTRSRPSRPQRPAPP
jgi:hypothetical protein